MRLAGNGKDRDLVSASGEKKKRKRTGTFVIDGIGGRGYKTSVFKAPLKVLHGFGGFGS